jgi:hypothetical protein
MSLDESKNLTLRVSLNETSLTIGVMKNYELLIASCRSIYYVSDVKTNRKNIDRTRNGTSPVDLRIATCEIVSNEHNQLSSLVRCLRQLSEILGLVRKASESLE